MLVLLRISCRSSFSNNCSIVFRYFSPYGFNCRGINSLSFTPQVYGDEEWSFGFCEQGSGVFSCPSGRNPMYTYRESIVLGKTNFSIFKVNQILRELSREWPGNLYDLLGRNCNHFCDEFCDRLGVPKLPGIHYVKLCNLLQSYVFLGATFLNSCLMLYRDELTDK